MTNTQLYTSSLKPLVLPEPCDEVHKEKPGDILIYHTEYMNGGSQPTNCWLVLLRAGKIEKCSICRSEIHEH